MQPNEWIKLILQLAVQLVAISYIIATIQSDVKWIDKEVTRMKEASQRWDRVAVESENLKERLQRLELGMDQGRSKP